MDKKIGDPDGTQLPTLLLYPERSRGIDLEVNVTTIKLIFEECNLEMIS